METTQATLIQKVLKFGIVGLSGMCVDFLITWICKEKIGLNKYVANTAGFSVAVVSNFFLNYIWTFNGNTNPVGSALIRFVIIAMIGLLLNNFFVYLFADFGSLNFYIAKALAIVCVFVWNFSANYFFNFHS